MSTDLKQRIIETSFSLFLRHGIKSITMDYIASQAGISKRTLYETFKDKDELLLECLTWNRQEIAQMTLKIASSAGNALEFLLETFMSSWARMRNVNRNYFSDMKRYHPNVAHMLNTDKVYQAQEMAAVIEQGKAEGVIRMDCRSDILSQLLATEFDFLFSLDEICTVKFTFMEAFEEIFKTYIRGIATPKGLEIYNNYFRTKP